MHIIFIANLCFRVPFTSPIRPLKAPLTSKNVRHKNHFEQRSKTHNSPKVKTLSVTLESIHRPFNPDHEDFFVDDRTAQYKKIKTFIFSSTFVILISGKLFVVLTSNLVLIHSYLCAWVKRVWLIWCHYISSSWRNLIFRVPNFFSRSWPPYNPERDTHIHADN